MRLGEALQKIGRDDEARAAYEAGIDQAEKFGRGVMVEDLRLPCSSWENVSILYPNTPPEMNSWMKIWVRPGVWR